MDQDPKKTVPLVEMFGPTIQGEGAAIGCQVFFLRFGLCDYKCTMCDSMHAVNPIQVRATAAWLQPDQVANALIDYRLDNAPNSNKHVILSGGNPCIHNLIEMVQLLRGLQWRVDVETQGTFAPSWLAHANLITVSPKGPGMGADTSLEQLDLFLIQCHEYGVFPNRVAIKVVAFDERDLELSRLLYERYRQRGYQWFLSLGNPWPPGFKSYDPLPTKSQYSNSDPEHIERLITRYRQLHDDIKNDPILSSWRFLPQWHVFVWGNEKGK